MLNGECVYMCVYIYNAYEAKDVHPQPADRLTTNGRFSIADVDNNVAFTWALFRFPLAEWKVEI